MSNTAQQFRIQLKLINNKLCATIYTTKYTYIFYFVWIHVCVWKWVCVCVFVSGCRCGDGDDDTQHVFCYLYCTHSPTYIYTYFHMCVCRIFAVVEVAPQLTVSAWWCFAAGEMIVFSCMRQEMFECTTNTGARRSVERVNEENWRACDRWIVELLSILFLTANIRSIGMSENEAMSLEKTNFEVAAFCVFENN